MARMFPEDIELYDIAGEGEKKVFRFLKEVARPHKEFLCWYQPSIGSTGKEPDFLLYGRKLGLLVLEVKDWISQQIISFNPHQFSVRISGTIEQKTNPLRQAKGYVHALMEQLKEIPEFISHEATHEGGLKIPIASMVVFVNISRHEYTDSKFKWFIESERALFMDDLDPAGELLCDTSGQKFRQRIAGAFPFLFKGLAAKEEEKLFFVLWPESKIALPLRQGSGKERFRKEVFALDESQARFALRLGSGHLVIKGPPGSGKTLVLVNRCCHLFRYHPQVKKILLVCFNIALVSYLRRLIQEKGIGTGDGGVQVFHFYEVCSRVLGEPVKYENEGRDYYELILQETLDRIKGGNSLSGPFDAVMVDEGQDFDEDMLKVLLALLRPGGQFVISLDSFQDLYMRRPSWISLGIKAGGRTHHLKRVYRNTVEIFEFSQRFIGQSSRAEKQLALLTGDLSLQGGAPEILKFQDTLEMEDFLITDIKECVNRGEYKKAEIGIIYDDKVYGPDGFSYDNRAMPMRLLRRMEASGIPTTWVSQDVRSKEMYDITTDRISLISIHSSKGLDFDLVYLVAIDHIRLPESHEKSLVSLIYVAMTRAKYRLVVPYVRETPLITRMKNCLPGADQCC